MCLSHNYTLTYISSKDIPAHSQLLKMSWPLINPGTACYKKLYGCEEELGLGAHWAHTRSVWA